MTHKTLQYSYNVNTCTVKPAHAVTFIKRSSFSCHIIEHFIWIEPLIRVQTCNNALNNIWAMIQKEYWCLIWNMNMHSASSIWSNLLSNRQMPRSISSKLFVIASGEANVYGSMRQATCLNDEVLKFQWHDDPYTLASPDAITNNFDDIDRGIW